MGKYWQEGDFVFASAIGTPLQPRNVLEDWYKLLKRAGLPRRKFHVARHTAVSLLIADGVPLRIVMELQVARRSVRLLIPTATYLRSHCARPLTRWTAPSGLRKNAGARW